MDPKVKQNYLEKIRLVRIEVLDTLDQEIKIMINKHASDGLLRSGATISRTMEFIAKGNARLYQEVLDHLEVLRPDFTNDLESEVQKIAEFAQEKYKKEALTRLEKTLTISSKPERYPTFLQHVEEAMATEKANFQNSLNTLLLKLLFSKSPINKWFWFPVVVLTAIILWICGMWFQDPEGNYASIVTGLTVLLSVLLACGYKFRKKKHV